MDLIWVTKIILSLQEVWGKFKVKNRWRITRKEIRSIFFPCASILCLERLHVWEESYLCLDFELEKSNRPSYREKHYCLGGFPINWWVVFIKGLGILPWISIRREVFGFFPYGGVFSLWRDFSIPWSLFLVFLFALWTYSFALS